MARMTAPLTDSKIKTSKPTEKEYILFDGQGLMIKVKPSGIKIWSFRYKSPTNDKTRELSLGKYPIISLQQARDKRAELLKLIAEGMCPLDIKKENKEKKQEYKHSNNLKSQFHTIAYEWLEADNNNNRLNEKYADRKAGLIDDFVIPYFTISKEKGKLHTRQINTITKQDIENIIKEKAKTAPETAKRLFGMLRNLWDYAIYKEHIDRNIINDIPSKYILPKVETKHYPKITDEKILSELLNAIDEYTGAKNLRGVLQIVVLIPLRANNLINLEWNQVDLKKQTITIPRKQMKLKNSNLDDFVLPLPNQVIKILEGLKAVSGNYQNVFANEIGVLPNIESPNRILQRMGFNDEKRGRKIRLHGFRGTFSSLIETNMLKHNIPLEVRERILDHHEQNKVAIAYSNKAKHLENMKKLLQWWADYLDEIRGY